MSNTGEDRLRIIHVVQAMVVGGIETLVHDFMKRDASALHECISLTHDKASLLARWPALSAVEARLSCVEKGDGIELGLIVKLARLFRRLRPDAVIAHHIGPLLYGGTAARLAGVKTLIHYEHDAWHYERAMNRRIVSLLSRVLKPTHVAVSENVSARLAELIGGRPVGVIAPGIDTVRYVPGDRRELRLRHGLDPDLRWIGTVGRLVAVKNQTALVKALAMLDERHACMIVGEGPERESIEEVARTLGLSNRVRCLGQRSDVHELIPAMDVFCLPSLNEGLPRSVLEAQSCGVPVVATDVGSVGEALHRPSGELVAPGDVEGLAAALGRVLSCNHDVGAIRRHILARYAISAVAGELERLAAGGAIGPIGGRMIQGAA